MKKTILFPILSLFFLADLFCGPHIADEKLPAGPKPEGRPSVALVLAGGGAKGFAHLPVIELIEELDIPIDMVVGTSIGSIIGGLYSAGYTPQQIDKTFQNVDWSPIFSDVAYSPYERTLKEHSLYNSLLSLNLGLDFSLKLGKGLSNGQKIYEMIKERVIKYPSDMDFNKFPVPFRAVTTDMLTGEALVYDEGDIAEAIRASMSIPSVFEPMEIDGKYCIDGGVRYNLAINVAKNMGYDIIIAIDISQKPRDNPDTFTANPGVAMLETITIAQYTATKAMYEYADLIITPEVGKYGTMDFKKSSVIYEEGKKAVEQYKADLEQLRKKIYPKDYDSNGKRISTEGISKKHFRYDVKPNLVINSVEAEGLLLADKKYLDKESKAVLGKQFTPEVFNNFMENIKLTGNYKNIKARVFEGENGSKLLLKMKQEEAKSTKICADIDFTQVVSTRTTAMLDFILGLQFRGLTGRGSVISFRGKTINDFGADLYYLQPINTNLFADLDLNVEDTRYPQLPFNIKSNDYSDYSSFKNFNAWASIGSRTDIGHTVKLGGYFKRISTDSLFGIDYFDDKLSEEIRDEAERRGLSPGEVIDEFLELTTTANSMGLFLNYEIYHLDSMVFPKKGLYFDFNGRYAFPFKDGWEAQKRLLILSAEGKAVIPMGSHMSLSTSALLGTDLLRNLSDSRYAMLTEGFTNFNRIYYPQICSPCVYGSNVLAGSLMLQLMPFHQLTILGGDLLFTLNGTFGSITQDFTNLIPTDFENCSSHYFLWSCSGGMALKVKASYSIYMRVGAGTTLQKTVAPFFSLDVGSISF